MKERLLRISALMLLIWYCFSVIGFNVHTCRASGDSFVTTVLTGITCEDIHPEHTCCAGYCKSGCSSSCHHHEHETAYKTDGKCCSDDYHMLLLTGSVSDDDRHEDGLSASFSFCSLSGHPADDLRYAYDRNRIRPPVPDIVSGRSIRPFLSIWRI